VVDRTLLALRGRLIIAAAIVQCNLPDVWFRVKGLGFRVNDLGFRVLGFMIWGLWFRVWGVECRVRGLGLEV
jgi:hypothetical protein